ncbi:MAG: hypothetical protein K8R53_03665 [Bacteroidales bacterium]|nr:hypothetical protein [Bacteroidales bacterium]
MKKLFWILLLIPFLFSCNQKEIERLGSVNDSLVNQANLRDASINEFLEAFNEIQGNLDSIKAKEMMISEKTKGKTELKKAAKDQINNDINQIYELLLENKKKIASLRSLLGNRNFQITELEKMVENLSKQIEEKDVEIEQLRADLEKMNIKITKLTQDVEVLTETNLKKDATIKDQQGEIEDKTELLNTAYYIIGNKKELKENNIITKEGGFIGIGKTNVLKKDFNEDLFARVDIRKLNKINIKGKKVEIVSSHPSESYTISGDKGNYVLEIKDHNQFWKSSKHLVIISD